MKYCIKCLYPSTKPDLFFNEQGICSACTAFELREKIDWKQREKEFKQLCNQLISDKHKYHCVIPVSGGKDSHYQVIKVLEYGLNPLAVCAVTDHLSYLGRQNLNNIANLCDLMEVNVNNKVRRKINAYTLREIGDISWAEHVTIFTIPIRCAISFNIPLVIYGENPQNEYGGPYQAQEARKLDKRWLQEYGGLNGLRVSDIEQVGIATKKELELYTYPNLDLITTDSIFLGQFFPWNGEENARVAYEYGFQCHIENVEGIGYNYENLDNGQTGIHDRLRYLKYGYGRCTDLVCNHIRRRSITRNEGREMILLYDNTFPRTYLGIPLEEILKPLDITIYEYIKIEEKFTNKDLFELGRNGRVWPLFLEDLKNA